MRTEAETSALLKEVKFPGFEFELYWHGFTQEEMSRRMPFSPVPLDARLRVTCKEGKCNVTGQPHSWNGRWWRLSQHMTDSEIVWTCWKAVLTALEHEAREQFTFKGVPIADSHVDVHKLADFMAQPSVKDGRAG